MKNTFKRILCIALAVIMTAGIFTVTASASSPERNEAFKAYYEYLQDEIDGIGYEVRDLDYYNMLTDKVIRPAVLKKILGTWLVDVTGDGVEELIIKRYVEHESGAMIDFSDKEWVCVYTYENGQIRRIGQNDSWARPVDERSWTYYEPEGFIGNILSSHEYPYISDDVVYVCTGSNGKVYLSDDKPVQGIEGTFSFYQYDGYKMSRVVKFEVNWVADWYYGSIHSNYGKLHYEVNDEKVSFSKFQKEVKKYNGKGYYELRNNGYEEVLDKVYEGTIAYFNPSDWAVAEVNEAFDKNYIPEGIQENYTKAITRAEFCALAVQFYESYTGRVITERLTFTDTNDVNVEKMAALGVVNGVGDGKFAPNQNLSRQEAAVILGRLAKVMGTDLPEGKVSFKDKKQIADWAIVQVGQINNAGVMNGIEGNKFDPLGSYTREQAILTVVRLSKVLL